MCTCTDVHIGRNSPWISIKIAQINRDSIVLEEDASYEFLERCIDARISSALCQSRHVDRYLIPRESCGKIISTIRAASFPSASLFIENHL